MGFLYCVDVGSFLWQCTIFMILFMGPNEWASSIRCFAKLEVLLLLRHAVLFFVAGRELSTRLSDIRFGGSQGKLVCIHPIGSICRGRSFCV